MPSAAADRATQIAQFRRTFEIGILDEDMYRAAAAALGENVVLNIGPGAVATEGGAARGQGGPAVAGEVGGDLLVNSTRIVCTGKDPKSAHELLNRYLRSLIDLAAV